MSAPPPPPPLPGEKIMTGPLDLNRCFSRGEGGGGGGLQILLIFLCCFSCLETVEYIKAQSFLHILSMVTWRSFIAMSQSFRILHFFCFFLQSFPSLLKLKFSSFFVMFQCFWISLKTKSTKPILLKLFLILWPIALHQYKRFRMVIMR